LQLQHACLPYLKYMRPLFPTLATANCLPSRPAEPPSGVISHLSSSWLPFLPRRAARFSSCDLRSVTGNKGFVCEFAETHGFVFPNPRPAAPRPVFARLPSFPGRGGCCMTTLSGDGGTRGGGSVSDSGCWANCVVGAVATDEGSESGSIARDKRSVVGRELSMSRFCCSSCRSPRRLVSKTWSEGSTRAHWCCLVRGGM
jgi:hypothetical protein